MQGLHMSEEIERQEFAKKAADWFAKEPKCFTFTDGEIVAGCWFAVRWGLGEDCVVVFKIDEDSPVVNYHQLIPRSE
jgi:hypothetical protein